MYAFDIFFKEVLILLVKELRCPVKFRYKFNCLDFFFFKKKLLTDQLFKEKKKQLLKKINCRPFLRIPCIKNLVILY